MAGAVLHRPLGAQVRDTIPIPARADSILKDSLAKRDSIEREKVRADSIKAPFARAEMPREIEIGRSLHWTRDSLEATGALTVADLLERVPGVSTLHAGWVSAPAIGVYAGDIKRVRVFYDGMEMHALDPRNNGALDLTTITLWSAEEATIEQAADEVRVYLRSWRVNRTIPTTRTDIATGDQATNLYRGFFGRRWHNGFGFQFGAQQYGTTPPSTIGSSSDQLGIIGRVGWARANWSVDGYVTRVGRHRGSIIGLTAPDSIPALESTRSDSYFRIGYRDPDTSGVWAQVMAIASKYDYTGVRTVKTTDLKTAADSALAVASLDTGVFRSQYLATAGLVRGSFRVSGGMRLFGGGGRSVMSPTARASFESKRLSVSVFGEGTSIDSVSHTDAIAELRPLSFVSLLGASGITTESQGDKQYEVKYLKAQAALRVKNLWLLGGMIRRDSARLAAPRVFDTLFVLRTEPRATGYTAGIRGQVWRLLHADVSAVRWDDTTGFYRPRYQTRSELYLHTNLLDRLPSGNFGLTASVVHEYRSGMNFPTAGGVVRTTTGYRTISTLLEIRVLQATVTWQFRNFLGERYSQVPSFLMPRQTNFYGVRWYFVD